MSVSASIDIANPQSWPVRLKRAEVAAILRASIRTLERRIASGFVPGPSADGTWSREVIKRFCDGGIDKHAELVRRHRLRMVGSARG